MSLFARGGWSSILLLASSWVVAAEPASSENILNALPENELASLSIGGVDRLQARGDALVEAVGSPMGMRLSQLVQIALRWFGVEDDADRQRPVSLILTNTAPRLQDWTGIVLSIPIQDRESLAKQLGIEPMERGVVPVRLSDESAASFSIGALAEDRLLVGCHILEKPAPAAVEAVLRSATLSERAGTSATQRLQGADLLLHGGLAQLKQQAGEDFKPEEFWSLLDFDADESPVAKELVTAALEAEDLYVAMTLEDGVRLRHLLQFPGTDGLASGNLLRELRSDAGDGSQRTTPSLRGLPAGPVLAAGATRLTQARQQLLMRAIVRLLYSQRDAFGARWLEDWSAHRLSDLRQSVFLGSLAEVLPLSSEVRFAIYPSGEARYATIVVLDTPDPDALVAAIHDLADELRSVDQTADAASEAEIQELIRQLNAEDFAARNRASTRLLIQGDRSLAWLDKAAESKDPATAERVRQLMAKLRTSTQQRAERLLTDNPLSDAHPRIIYRPRAEMYGDASADVLQLELPPDEQSLATPLREIFGPEWDRVRIVRLPGQVVLSFGAALPWLPETIRHCRTRQAGLAQDSRLVSFDDDPDRLLILHVPVSRFVPENPHRFFPEGEPKNKSPSLSLTGFGVSATDRELQLDVHAPLEEVRGLVVKRGWNW